MKKNNIKIIFAVALITGLTGLSMVSQAIAADYAIVVNAANNTTGSKDEMRRQVQRIFMKMQTSWPGDIVAFPLDREKSSAEHQAFLKNVLGKNEQELESHWRQVKQQQGTTPPRTVGASRILLRLIGKKEGGMGVVNIADLNGAPDTIKVLFQFSD